MAESTGISWTDSTFNPWMGCAKISPGCDNCYAEVSTPSRTLSIVWGPNEARRRTSSSNWLLPRKWNLGHAEFFAQYGRKRRVFCASLADVFDNKIDPTWRHELWALIRETPNLDWLILTKRIGNVAAMVPYDWPTGFPNVWLGISVVNQDEADRDIPKLFSIPAALRWLSMEPLLGPVDIVRASSCCEQKIDWVVVGGESGPHARPMQSQWVDDLRHQCLSQDVAFFFKQWGGSSKNKGGCQLAGQESKAWPLLLN